jgi:hypothetical protein
VITGDRLFDSNGHMFSMSLGFQVGTFLGGGNFLLDPSYHRLFFDDERHDTNNPYVFTRHVGTAGNGYGIEILLPRS